MKSNLVNIISSSSSGNAYIYFENILLDIGVPYTKIKPYTQQIKYVLLTHTHSDHFNIKTLKKLLYENPKIRVCCGWYLVEKLLNNNIPAPNIFVLETEKNYIIGDYSISSVMAYHDVPNIGYKIHNNRTNKKIFHISDTSQIDHIEAKDYDFYALEGNYEADDVLQDIIKAEEDEYGFSYRKRVLTTHLSQVQALNWLDKNKGEKSNYTFIHQHIEKNEKNS